MERLGRDVRSLAAPACLGGADPFDRDRTLFHAFGPWENAEHIAAMRGSPEATAAFRAIQDLCVEMLPGDYELVAHVRVRDQQASVRSD